MWNTGEYMEISEPSHALKVEAEKALGDWGGWLSQELKATPNCGLNETPEDVASRERR
jgi:hypothetical protein